MYKPALIFSSFLLLMVPCYGYEGKVIKVYDGDTLTVKTKDKKIHKVRLARIDCPEKDQSHGEAARKHVSDLVLNQTVSVNVRDTDRYKREVADVVLPGGICLNESLVLQGHAWWYQQYAKDDLKLKGYQDEARAAKRGLWSNDLAMAPWQWRKERKAEKKTALERVKEFLSLPATIREMHRQRIYWEVWNENR